MVSLKFWKEEHRSSGDEPDTVRGKHHGECQSRAGKFNASPFKTLILWSVYYCHYARTVSLEAVEARGEALGLHSPAPAFWVPPKS